MHRFTQSLTFKIGSIIVLIELVALSVVGAIYVTRFSKEVDRRIETQVRLPSVLMNAGLLALDAVADGETMRKLVGEDLITGMVVGINGNVFYSLDPIYLGQNVAEVPGVEAGLFDATNPQELIIRESQSVIAISPIYGADGHTARFFAYIAVEVRAAVAEKSVIFLLFVLGSVATIVLTTMALLFSFRWVIFRRLADLQQILSLVEAGDLTAKVVKANSRDEIGALQRGANAMIAGRKQAEERIIRLNRVLRAIRNVNQLITKEKKFDHLIESCCDRLIETDSYSSAWIILFNEEGTPIRFVLSDIEGHDFSLSNLLELEELMPCLRNALSQPGVQVIDYRTDICRDCIMSGMRGNHNVLATRLEYAGKIYGVLNVSVLVDFSIDAEERSLFAEVAGDISFALYNQALEKERDKANEERETMRAQVIQSQKLESIGMLAGGVAHEINNPITGIMNYAQLIKDKMEPESGEHEFASEIIVETERVATIVSNLLTFARHDKQTHSPARMVDIVNGVTSLIRTVIKRDQVILEEDVPEDLPKLKCRNQQIQQVVMNLLTNARDALNQRYEGYDENKTIRISAHTFEQKGRVWIRTTVEDHGNGIPAEVRERMFDPFFTTKDRAKGTGLGLSISHGIVSDHHGELTVESEAGEYTRFHLDLPVDN
jgi:signal transduction histidine kinase/HAMP domain-containing protein